MAGKGGQLVGSLSWEENACWVGNTQQWYLEGMTEGGGTSREGVQYHLSKIKWSYSTGDWGRGGDTEEATASSSSKESITQAILLCFLGEGGAGEADKFLVEHFGLLAEPFHVSVAACGSKILFSN